MKQDQKKVQVWPHSIMACGGSVSLRPVEKTTQTQGENKKETPTEVIVLSTF